MDPWWIYDLAAAWACRYAKFIGAEVYATAGAEEKHEFLRSLGVPWCKEGVLQLDPGEIEAGHHYLNTGSRSKSVKGLTLEPLRSSTLPAAAMATNLRRTWRTSWRSDSTCRVNWCQLKVRINFRGLFGLNPNHSCSLQLPNFGGMRKLEISAIGLGAHTYCMHYIMLTYNYIIIYTYTLTQMTISHIWLWVKTLVPGWYPKLVYWCLFLQNMVIL